MFGKAVKVLNKAIVIILVLGFTLVGVNFSFPRYLGTVAYADDETPSPTPTETPIPTSSPSPLPIPETSSLLSQRNTTLSSLIDSDGYLTDAGLLSLKVLPDDPQRYIDTKNYSNGKKSLLLYSNAIKYKNKNGKYELIDNSIIDANDSVYKYKNKASDIEVLLSDDLNQNSAINVNYLGYSIGFKPLGILKKVDGKGQAELSLIDTNIEGQNDKTLIANKKYDSIEYSKTFNEDTKINITPASSGIKEDIILSSIPKQAEFSYELKVDNATPVLRRDGNVYFVDLDKGVIVAAIAAPIMNDSSPESGISSDIDVKLEKVDDTTYKYTLIPDKTYLKNAIYPVVIDPTVTRPGDIGDTWVQSNSSQDYSNSTKFIVGRSSAGTKFRGLIIINSTGLTYLRDKFLGCRIDEVKYHAYESYSGSSSPTIEVHPILESWNYGYVYWGIQPDFDTVAYSSATVQAVGPYEWNVTAPAKDWIYNTADYCHSRYQPSDPYYNSPTYGILLKITNESLNQYKEFSSDQNSSNKDYFEFFFTDTIAPNQPQVVEKTSWTFQPGVDTGSITVRCSKCTDLPTDYAVGTKEYWFERSLDGGTTWGDRHTVAYNGADYQSYIFTGIPDNTSVKFRVCAVDNNYPSPNPNTSPWTVSSLYNSPDCTAPVVPQNQVYASPDASINYKNVTNPTIYWSGVTDEGNHFEKVEYVVDNTNGTWQTLGTTTSGSHQITISGDGIHTIYIRGKDTSNNYTSSVNYATITYKLDSTAPMATLSVPSGNLQGIVEVTATITNNGAGSNPAVCNWTLDYGNGNPATSFITPALASGTTAKNNEVIFEWDTTALTNNQYYTLRLIASDDIGNSNALNPATVIRLKSSDSIGVDPGLQIDQPSGYNPDGYQPDTSTADQYTITSPSTNVEYEKKGNDNQGAGINGLSNGQLYANNKQVDSNATTNDGHLVNNFNAAAYDNGWLYPEGSIVFLYAQAKDTTQGDIFSTSTQQSLEISDTFDNTNKIDPDPQSKSNIEQVNGVMRLTNDAGVYNSPGKFESAVKTFAGEVSYIDLIVNQTTPGNSSISYQVLVDGTWSSITPISTDGGTTSNPANRKYYTTSSGDSVKLKATLTKSSGNETPTIMSWSIYVRFTTYVNAVLVDNSFPQNARGITNLTNTTHNETNESIELKYDANLQKYAESGSVESTMRYTSNDVIQACLEVNETKPANTNITYSISTNGTNGTFIPITPGDASKLSNWMSLSTPGKQVVIKAELSSTDSSVTPKLNWWNLSIKEEVAGQPHMVKLVDEPWNLSTLTGANYMTLLRWEKSDTEGVTYNVYRSTTPYFVPSDATKVAPNLTENSWNDHNLNYGQTFYYQVTAVKNINGQSRESLPSNQAWATVVSENEMQKQLGLENYWTYTGFSTGSGTGYINVSNGNVVYNTTDIVVSDPFFAMVMRRTFNSLANTKTAMGYGWDFSFNTCLMREYEGSGTTEKGMLLKDGDGSFHRFLKNGSGYNDAPGSFMKLQFEDNDTPADASDDEYQIIRKDNITYHFNAQSMRLKSFTDNNGNALAFTYDERGNIYQIENNVGEKVTLTYYADGNSTANEANPNDADYTYVNEHPDMLKTVNWTEDTQTDPASITYTYEYNSRDRLTRANTTIENNTTYQEQFGYDANTYRLLSISDPKNKVTGIAYDAAGRASRITYANGDYYDFAYTILGIDQYKTTVTDKYGVSTQYKYDAIGLLYEKDDPLYTESNPTLHRITYAHNDIINGQNTYLVTGMSYYNTVNGGTIPELISYSYNYINGNLHSISGPDGTYTEYGAYNIFNKPASVSVKKDSSTTLTTYFEYDNGNLPLTNGNLTKTTDPEGKATTRSYTTYTSLNSQGQAVSHFGYLDYVKDTFGKKTKYIYDFNDPQHYPDPKGRVIRIEEYNNDTYVRTATTYSYDYNVYVPADQKTYFMMVTATDAMGNSAKTYYDSLGRQVKVVKPDNTHATFEYDLASNLKKATDCKGYETNYTYDDLHRLTDTTYENDTASGIGYFKWDSDNNTNTGDANGNDADKIVVTDATGVKSIKYYDMAGRVIKTSTSNGSSEIVTAQYQYDLIGNCTQVTDNAGRISQAQYNKLGQTTKTITDPAGENIQTTCTYDWLGNKLSVTNGEGYTTSYTYDDDARLLNTIQIDNKGTTATADDVTLTTSHTYDIQEGGYIKNRTTDAVTHVSESWFDVMGRKVEDFNRGDTSDGDDAAAEYMQTSYSYNANFQTDIVTRNDNTKEKYTYNSLGKVTRIDYYEATESTSGPSDVNKAYDYDNNGNVTLESVYHGTNGQSTSYSYDDMNRVNQMVEGDLQNGGLSINYDYDDAGKVIQLSYTKEGALRKLGYVYDGYGRIHYITLALGSGDPQTVREYSYKANGDLDYMKDFRDFENDGTDYIKTVYSINNAGLTTNITYTDHSYNSQNQTWTEATKEEYTMGYDDRGYITSETAYTNYTEEKTVDKTYKYDSIGRLLHAVIGDKTNDYTYDNVGNRLTKDDGTDLFTSSYNQFNQLTGMTKKHNSGTAQFYASYGYDVRGNQTQEVRRAFSIGSDHYNLTTNYTYDLLDTMAGTTISTPKADHNGDVTYEDTTMSYEYNAQGQRVIKVDKDETTKYYYTGGSLLFTTNAANWLTTENILDRGGKIVASLRFADQDPETEDAYADKYYFYHFDKRGSTTAIVLPDGNMVKGYEYDEFGNLEGKGADDFLNEVTYTGSITDKSTGLQYMNSRYYNPSTGRFLSQDSYTGNPYDPWTQHLYSYCANNPTNFIDPTGHRMVDDEAGDYQYGKTPYWDSRLTQECEGAVVAANQQAQSLWDANVKAFGSPSDDATGKSTDPPVITDKNMTTTKSDNKHFYYYYDSVVQDLLANLPDDPGGDVVRQALLYLGLPYGRSNNGSSYDCSSLTWTAFNGAGVGYAPLDGKDGKHIPTAATQASYCAKYFTPTKNTSNINDQTAKPGDVVFWENPANGGINHVAIYAGNGFIVEAGHKGIVLDKMWNYCEVTHKDGTIEDFQYVYSYHPWNP